MTAVLNIQLVARYIYAAFAGKPPGEIIDSLIDTPTNGTQTDTGAGGEWWGIIAR